MVKSALTLPSMLGRPPPREETRLAMGGYGALYVAAVTVLITGAPVYLIIEFVGDMPGVGVFWYMLAPLGVLAAAARPLRSLAALARFPVTTGFALLGLASAAWSFAPGATLEGALFLWATVLSAVAAVRLPWRDILAGLTLAFGVVGVLSLLLATLAPSIGRMTEGEHVGAWSGVFPEKQMLGFVSVLALVATAGWAVVSGGRAWRWAVLIGLVHLTLIVGATGRTALLMTGLALLTFAAVWGARRGPALAIVTALAAAAFAVGAAWLASGAADDLLRALGREPTLTSRTDIWRAVDAVTAQRPTLGWGYQAIWTEKGPTAPVRWIWNLSGFEPANAHSTWRDVRLQLGPAGLGLLAGALAGAWARAVGAAASTRAAYFALPALAAMTLATFTETLLLYPFDVSSWLFVLIAAKLARG